MCCEDLNNFLKNYTIIEYDKVDRTISINVRPKRNVLIKFCPFCGTEFPSRLNSKILDVIEEEYGIPRDEADVFEGTNLPEEFKSDEWWKKRGL
jgi:hypothetical protein